MAIIQLTTGVPGCGKTYVRGSRFVADYLLPETDLKYITNLPLYPDKIADFVSKKKFGFFGRFFRRRRLSSDSLKSRIFIIPSAVIDSWRSEKSGPWDLFSCTDLTNTHIAIDEIHEIVSPSKSPDYLKLWDDWLGTVRHTGATIEFITQDVKQVDQIILGRVAIRNEISPCEDLRDPFFSILLLDWYNLKAALTGEFHKTSTLVEMKKNASGRFKENHRTRFLLLPEYFDLYNSYNDSRGTGEGSTGVFEEYQKHSRVGTVLWFVRKNFLSLFLRFSILGFAIWLLFFGGLVWCIGLFTSSLNAVASSNTVKIDEKTSEKTSSTSSQAQNPSPGFCVAPTVYKSSISSSDSDSIRDKKLENLEKLLSEKIARINELERKLSDTYLPSFFYSDRVVLRNGLIIRQGHIFAKGTYYEGKKVTFISFVDRYYVMSDGSVMRMLPVLQ